MTPTSAIFTAAALLLAAPPGASSAPPAQPAEPVVTPTDQLLDRVQAFVDSTPHFTAEFEQVAVRSRTGRRKTRKGRVRALRPDRIRWDYAGSAPVHYVAAGKVLWAYQPKDARAYRLSLDGSDLDQTVRVLAGGAKLAEAFKTEEIAPPDPPLAPGLRYLKLEPPKPTGAFRYLVLGIEPESGRVAASALVDADGNEVRTTYRYKEGPPPKPAVFEFKPPPGVSVEDVSSSKQLRLSVP